MIIGHPKKENENMQTILRTKEEIKEIVSLIRLELYNKGLLCGPKAIRKEMEASGEANLPSERTIARILSRQGLTHQRTGRYE